MKIRRSDINVNFTNLSLKYYRVSNKRERCRILLLPSFILSKHMPDGSRKEVYTWYRKERGGGREGRERVRGRGRERETCGMAPSLIRTPVPLDHGSTLKTWSHPDYLLKTHLQIPSHWGSARHHISSKHSPWLHLSVLDLGVTLHFLCVCVGEGVGGGAEKNKTYTL